jgi:hypothetical protein
MVAQASRLCITKPIDIIQLFEMAYKKLTGE